MSLTDFLEFIAALLASIGGAGIIIVALSSWLGKVWADRLMQKERTLHDNNLAELRGKLQTQSDEYLAGLKNDLDIFKETHLKEHTDKIAIYRSVIDIISSILAELELVSLGIKKSISNEILDSFGRERLRAYGYLGMLAPQTVVDSHDNLIDHIIGIIYDGNKSEWIDIRNLSIKFINSVRNDIGINKEPIEYHGDR